MNRLIAALTVISCLSITTGASATWDVWLELEGEKQGRIEGEPRVTAGDREGHIRVGRFQCEVISPRDASSALPTGARQHKPVTITKLVDKSSPLKFQAMVDNEKLPRAVFKFYRKNAKGLLEMFQTIELRDAAVAGDKQVPTKSGMMEVITFVYGTVEIVYVKGGITAMDVWEQPVR